VGGLGGLLCRGAGLGRLAARQAGAKPGKPIVRAGGFAARLGGWALLPGFAGGLAGGFNPAGVKIYYVKLLGKPGGFVGCPACWGLLPGLLAGLGLLPSRGAAICLLPGWAKKKPQPGGWGIVWGQAQVKRGACWGLLGGQH